VIAHSETHSKAWSRGKKIQLVDRDLTWQIYFFKEKITLRLLCVSEVRGTLKTIRPHSPANKNKVRPSVSVVYEKMAQIDLFCTMADHYITWNSDYSRKLWQFKIPNYLLCTQRQPNNDTPYECTANWVMYALNYFELLKKSVCRPNYFAADILTLILSLSFNMVSVPTCIIR
jgi:hypothetical protein